MHLYTPLLSIGSLGTNAIGNSTSRNFDFNKVEKTLVSLNFDKFHLSECSRIGGREREKWGGGCKAEILLTSSDSYYDFCNSVDFNFEITFETSESIF